jgi:trk system potassium uptake protein TrkA
LTRFAIIGLGTFGMALARALARRGAQVTAVDNETGHIDAVKDEVHTAIRMDSRDRDALTEQGIHDVDCAVVCMGEDFEAAEICAVHLTDLGCRRVLVRGTTRERAEILSALGPEVITPGIRSADHWAVRLLAPPIVDYAELAGDHDVALFRVPERAGGTTLGEMGLDSEAIRVLALRRGKEVFVGPGATQDVRAGDDLFLMGEPTDLIRVAEEFRD